MTSFQSQLTDAKKALRAEATIRRGRARSAAGDDAGYALGERVETLLDRLGRLERAVVVSGYWPMRDEIDVRPALARLARRGARLALPVVVKARSPLLFRRWAEGDALADGGFGTRVPVAEAAEVRPDVLLVPLLAFDRAGWRLGYGGGFYDRTLAKLRGETDIVAVGVAYAGQELADVPHGESDQPLDAVVTERETVGVSVDGRGGMGTRT